MPSRRTIPRRLPCAASRFLLIALFAAGCGPKAGPDRVDPLGLFPAPPTISASQAGENVGQLVIVQAMIGAARVEQGRALLQPVGQGPGGFVIVIAPALLGVDAEELVARYAGQEVAAMGYVSDLGDRLELLIGDPDRVRLAGASADTASVAVASEPASADAASVAVVSETVSADTASVAVVSETVSADTASVTVDSEAVSAEPARRSQAAISTPVQSAPARDTERDQACQGAQRAWRVAADQARVPLTELLHCLDGTRAGCTQWAARVRTALAEIAASEERLRWVCGGGS